MCCFCRYVSKYRPIVVHERKSVKDDMRTMGPAKVEVPSPDKYLKKHSKEPKLPESEFCVYTLFCILELCHLPFIFYIFFQRQSVRKRLVAPAL